MKIKNIVTILLVTMILISCAPVATVVPTETAIPTSTFTPIPPTATITPTLTAAPTPMGGGTLKVAFYASDSNGRSKLIVGDYFSGVIEREVSVRGSGSDLSWSPDGTYLLFVDTRGLITEDPTMIVNLLNVKTGKVTHLSTFPDSDGTRVNYLYIKWSTDNKYVLYYAMIGGGNVASVDGIVQTPSLGYAGWLSDTNIMAENYNGSIFDVEKKEENFNMLSAFQKLGQLEFTRDFMLLDNDTKDKVEAISYPDDVRDVTSWQYDTLINSKVTLITFSPEVTNPYISRLLAIAELPNHQLSISGLGFFAVADKEYQYFRVVVDKENLPVVVKEQDLYGVLDENFMPSTIPAAFSPDGQLVLLGSFVKDETWFHIRFTLKDIQGRELRVDEKLSQFSGVTYNSVWLGSSDRSFFDGIAFYWQP